MNMKINRFDSIDKNLFEIKQASSDFATFLGLKGTVYIMGTVVNSQGDYIVLAVEQYNKKETDEGIGTEIGAKVYLIKISVDGKKELGRIIYEGKDYIEIPMAIEIDLEDNIYITGMSIKVPNILDIINILKTLLTFDFNGGSLPFEILQGFILKFKSTNMILNAKPIFSIHFGGNGITMPFALADDKRGNLWITGMTSSTNFPVKGTPEAPIYQRKNSGSLDVFICKVSTATPSLEYSTYLGGYILDIAQSIYADNDGNIYVTGIADKVENEKDSKLVGHFNVTPSAFQTNFGGGLSDSFIIKLKNSGQVVYCSYLGGSDSDTGTSVTADNDGNAYITGSTGRHFPIKGSSFQKDLGYKNEGIFIAKINKDGTEIIASTYLGGFYADASKMVQFTNNALSIYGTTSSKDFPMCPKTYDPIYFGDTDMFFSSLSPDLSTLTFSSYLGGTKRDSASTMIILKDGSFLLLGDTISRDFPTTKGVIHEIYDNVRGEGFLFRGLPLDFSIEVNIPDINLKNSLKEILKQNPEDKITIYNLMTLPRSINLNDKSIKNLEGLQYAKYLLELDLNDNELEDISILSELKYLNYLNLRNNKIKDISPLKNLINLSYLYLSNNEIEDISSIENLKLMTDFKAENNKIQSIAVTASMNRIRTIILDNNNICDLSYLNNSSILSKVSVLSQTIIKIFNKRPNEDLVLPLNFLKKINSELPLIYDISNNGVLDPQRNTITWKGISTDINLTFKFKGINGATGDEYMSGSVIIQVKNDYSPSFGSNPSINGFSTFLAFETPGLLTSMVKDSKGNYYVLYNEYEVITIFNNPVPISKEIVIKKISSDGKSLLGMKQIKIEKGLFSTSKTISSKALAIDINNDIYLVGNTNWDGLPTTPGVIMPRINPEILLSGLSNKGFIMKFNGENFNANSKPIYSTYIGGNKNDSCESIVVDKNGNPWIIGMTTSTNFPLTKDTAYKTTITSIYGNLFLTKLKKDFSDVEYSTLLGAKAIDGVYSLTLDKDGNVYATGAAEYVVAPEYRYKGPWLVTDQDFWKTTENAYQKHFGGGESDSFVVKFKSNGEVVYVTYLGGGKMDIGVSISVDDNGCAYVAGYTKGDFIITENSYSKIYDAKEAGIFITKLSSDGREVLASTYFGGSYSNFVKGIYTINDKAYLVGNTNSLDFETTETALQKEYTAGTHGFLSIFSSDLSGLSYSTFIKGSSSDTVNNIVVDQDGTISLAGNTDSPDFPVTNGVYRDYYSNNPQVPYLSGDGFLMRFKISES